MKKSFIALALVALPLQALAFSASTPFTVGTSTMTYFSVDASTSFFNTNVGIGAGAFTAYPLDVRKSQNTPLTVHIQNSSSGTIAETTLSLGNDLVQDANAELFFNSSTNANYGGVNSLNLYNYTQNGALTFGTNFLERMRITANGNVGIGTTTPQFPLTIASSNLTGLFLDSTSPTADAYMSMGVNPSTGPAFNFGYGGASLGRGAAFINVRPDASAVAPNPSLRISTANITAMIIDNNQRIGIGTVSPAAKLDVAGSINVGSSAASKGITLYDDVGGAAYCVKIHNGALVPSAGACAN